MVKIYESKKGGSLELKDHRVIEFTGKTYSTELEDVQKMIEALPCFGVEIWEAREIAEPKRKPGRPKIVTGPRTAEV